MTQRQKLLVTFKLFFGLLAFSSIITELVVLNERSTLIPANFFSFFTIESNLFAATVLIVSALLTGRARQPFYMGMIRGAATLYMLMTGIIFAILLSGLNVDLTAVPWDNVVLHYIMPTVLIVDWIIDPPRKSITFRNGIIWMVFPILYVVYTLARGVFTGWYPYPFLNPSTGGYGKVLVMSLIITAGVLSLVWVMTQPGQVLGSKSKLKK